MFLVKLKFMKKNNLSGFSIIEVAVSITLFTILAPSIYMMISYLLASSNSISVNYLDELVYRSYLERQVILSKGIDASKTFDNIKLLNRSQKISLNIQKTPNNKIFLISIKPSNKFLPLLKAYIRDK